MSSSGDIGPSAPLREEIRARLAAGSLPLLTAEHRIYAGLGDDQACSGCGQPVAKREVLYEIELAAHGISQPLRLHLDCFSAWVLESHTETFGLSDATSGAR